MNKRQVIGYFLLAAKESGLSQLETKKVLDKFVTVLRGYSNKEAEELGIDIQLELTLNDYEERLSTYEKLYQMKETDSDAIKALEALSISMPIKTVDHERLKQKYKGNENDDL
ncbi:MAG: hypothetical protein ACQEUT_18320 [Bacillota bacterium]